MPTNDTTEPPNDRLQATRYIIRARLRRLFGRAFHIYDDTGALVLYCAMKRLRLREDIRLYTDESQTTEWLRIRTQSAFDIPGGHDIVDSATDQTLGTLSRSGPRSMFVRDQWTTHDAVGTERGRIEEDSLLKGLLRRYIEFLGLLLPQRYDATWDGRPVATCRQRLNPIAFKLDLDFSPDVGRTLDRRLGIAAAIVLSTIDGREG